MQKSRFASRFAIVAAIALACASAMAANVMSESVSDGQTVQTRTLTGNTLTSSVCQENRTALATQTHCVSEVVKLSRKEFKLMQASFLLAQTSITSDRGAQGSSSSGSSGNPENSGLQSKQMSFQSVSMTANSVSRSAGVGASASISTQQAFQK